ncbi:MAG: hypothetical protein K1000chlam4_00208 [Chlamydiae bacterium]|nr:hypothetical protein [Chlamydiota bacterium]
MRVADPIIAEYPFTLFLDESLKKPILIQFFKNEGEICARIIAIIHNRVVKLAQIPSHNIKVEAKPITKLPPSLQKIVLDGISPTGGWQLCIYREEEKDGISSLQITAKSRL